MNAGREQRDVGRRSDKGGVYHDHSRLPHYGSGVEQGRGNGFPRQRTPGRGINSRRRKFQDPLTMRKYCKFFDEGHCKFGEDCRNIHEAPEQMKEVLRPGVCKFFAAGLCKFGADCIFEHSQT